MAGESLIAAVGWVGGLLTGAMATVVAIIAVAGVGLLALAGRVASRRAFDIVLGCFILFSASTIARGLTDSLAGQRDIADATIPPPTSSYTPTSPPVVPYDPYAGASVPIAPQPGIIR